MSAENKRIARRYFLEIMNMANMDSLYELLAPDFLFTLATHPEPYHGPDGFKELVTMLHSAFPDFYINIQEMVADGDTVDFSRATNSMDGSESPPRRNVGFF